jgi:hypothetical protein
MKKTILGLGIVLTLAGASIAQRVDSRAGASAESNTKISKKGGDLDLQSGTQIAAQLENQLDVRRAKVGDQVFLKTSKAVKQNGKTVINKGSKLVGRVTEVSQKAGGNGMSKVGILFDRLEQGGQQLPINAMITSVTQAGAQASVDDTFDSDISARNSTQTSASSGGGLLSGVGNTVGGVANGATNTVGSVANAAGRTVNGTTRTVGNTLRGVRVSQSTDASAEGGSLLSLQGGDLRLEKGTTFNLSLSSSTSIND